MEKINRDPEVIRYLNRPVDDAAVARFHAGCIDHWQEHGFGFFAVESDNIAGWENENHPGFNITRREQLRFNRWVSRQVHARGMAVALKNGGRQAAELAPDFDFAIVEECFKYHECGYYKNTFVKEGKAVFEAEYEQEPKAYCKTATAIGFSAIRKSLGLFAEPWRPCASAGRG